jgi:hypothetical protein
MLDVYVTGVLSRVSGNLPIRQGRSLVLCDPPCTDKHRTPTGCRPRRRQASLLLVGVGLFVSCVLTGSAFAQATPPSSVGASPSTTADTSTAETRNARIVAGLDQLSDTSDKLNDWALLIFGGTVLVLVGASYRRPSSRWVRSIYFLLPVAWVLLGLSLWKGFEVKQFHAALPLRPQNATVITQAVGGMMSAFDSQLTLFKSSLIPLAPWLVAFTAWWVLSRGSDANPNKEGADV